MSVSLFLQMADQSLGKADKTTFSQHTQFQLFIDGITNKNMIYGEKLEDEPADIRGWVQWGVVLDKFDEMVKFDWCYSSFEGSINLQWLPPSFQSVGLSQNSLSGSIRLDELPRALENLDLSFNFFEGEIDLCHLPDSLNELKLNSNQLNGSLNLTLLPVALHVLALQTNSFTGSISLTNLPNVMIELHLSNNRLSGPISLSNLPLAMRELHLNGNDFSGSTDFSHIRNIYSLSLSSNPKLSGTIMFGLNQLVGADDTQIVIDHSGYGDGRWI